MDEVGEGRQRLLDRRVGIGPVQLVQVDPPSGSRRSDRSTALRMYRAILRPSRPRATRTDEPNLRPARLAPPWSTAQRSSDAPYSGRVEEGDSVQRRIDDGAGGVEIDAHAEAAAAQTGTGRPDPNPGRRYAMSAMRRIVGGSRCGASSAPTAPLGQCRTHWSAVLDRHHLRNVTRPPATWPHQRGGRRRQHRRQRRAQHAQIGRPPPPPAGAHRLASQRRQEGRAPPRPRSARRPSIASPGAR